MTRFDFSLSPYHTLNIDQRALLEKSADIVFFDDDSKVLSIGDTADALYVVIKGTIKEVDADNEIVALYHPKDSFDTRALFKPVLEHDFVVAEQSLLYAIPKKVILSLMEQNNDFGAYFYANIADKLKNQATHHKEQELTGLFVAKVADAYRHHDHYVDGNTSLSEAAHLMRQQKSKSLLITHQERVGLITESVFRDVIASASCQPINPQDPIHQWATFNMISIDIDEFMFSALLKMLGSRIQRVVVTKDDKAIGVLEQIDILAFLSNHSHLIAEQLECSGSIDELSEVASHMTDTIAALHSSGMQVRQLAELMQVLNGRLFEKAWQMIAPKELFENSCLIVMGSEGRGEQILKTDQDNALIVKDGIDIKEVLPYTQKFSAVLESFGYPPCTGNIMVNNPMWCQNLSDFKQMLGKWALTASPENMMYLAIFMDAKAVAGEHELLLQAKKELQSRLSNDTGMLMSFARAVSQFDEHGRGFFAQILGQQKHKMDIKKMGIFPVVHGVRALSLQAGLDETSTFERISQLAKLGIIEKQLSQDIGEALAYLMSIRLKTGLFAYKHHLEYIPNQIDTDNLSTLERDLLKDALQVVKRFKHSIRSHFNLQN